MKSRTTIVYMAAGFMALSLIAAAYFFLGKPEKPTHALPAEGKTVIVFKDVKYSGEKKGLVDWEIRAKIARKYIDKPAIEMEILEGEYKPKAGTIVLFKGSKGFMDTENEKGSVEDVDIIYNREYTLTTNYLDFDFKKGLTTTSAPVKIQGSKLMLTGVGLTADTKKETIRIEKDVSGFVVTQKGKYNFAANSFLYYLKDNLYVLDGKAMMKGEDLDVSCSRLSVFSDGEDIQKIDARGKVRLVSKGHVAKSEQAVYHFKQDKAVPTASPGTARGKTTATGEAIAHKSSNWKLAVGKPTVRMEQR
ncbi:MAG: LPS export ABC transporter periplasmic protein LptC [Syntrophorhabdus aromaticivorans]|uniref:LPS export ABC transporter periplasmic protein LptC n=1 Tax=Syntrophorhabdus aromaticivorans TaxID=328301 RepID=A0A351U0Z3_9BACT|nr:LPS export ABC transporter periplasmic protein LptC [Syntrophorhabdus aromaticivorans]HBA53624.1 LPS export ABC transporter periplasmic protein LptC [Syntrophorhabdus aromaticivorans]